MMMYKSGLERRTVTPNGEEVTGMLVAMYANDLSTHIYGSDSATFSFFTETRDGGNDLIVEVFHQAETSPGPVTTTMFGVDIVMNPVRQH